MKNLSVKQKVYLTLQIIFMILAFIGGILLFIGKLDNAGMSVAFGSLYQNSKK